MEQIKALIEGLKRDFEEFKKSNDAALAAKAEKGHVDAALQVKVDAINADITVKQTQLTARLDEMERAKQIERALGGAHKPEAVLERCEAFAQSLSERAHNPEVRHQAKHGLVTPALLAAYESGFNKIIRFGREAARLTPEERAAMEVGSDPKGGLLLPPMVERRVVEMEYETTPMRQIAAIETIDGDSFPLALDLDEVDGGWVGEKEARPETDTADLSDQEIKLREVYANPSITQKLLDLGKSPEERLARKIAAKFSRMENTAFVSGATPKRPRGFLTYAAGTPGATAATWNKIQQVNSGASGAFAATKPGDKIIDLVHSLKSSYHANARFLTARLTLSALRQLKDGQDNYLWQSDFAKGPNGTLLSYPITIGEDMPALASASLSLAFGDFKQGYTIVDGAGIRTLVDPYTNKPKVHFYTTKRVGGDVSNFEAIKLMKFSS